MLVFWIFESIQCIPKSLFTKCYITRRLSTVFTVCLARTLTLKIKNFLRIMLWLGLIHSKYLYSKYLGNIKANVASQNIVLHSVINVYFIMYHSIIYALKSTSSKKLGWENSQSQRTFGIARSFEYLLKYHSHLAIAQGDEPNTAKLFNNFVKMAANHFLVGTSGDLILFPIISLSPVLRSWIISIAQFYKMNRTMKERKYKD